MTGRKVGRYGEVEKGTGRRVGRYGEVEGGKVRIEKGGMERLKEGREEERRTVWRG